MLICRKCKKPSFLILNTCAECDPELHKAWKKAVDSSVDFDTATPEIVDVFLLIQKRKDDLKKDD